MEADRVAVQCPYSGGPAVYRARTLISLINDSMQYEDEMVCGILGIMRAHSLTDEAEKNYLKVFPNPASQSVQLVYSGLKNATITLEVLNTLGQLVISKNILSYNNTYYLDLSNLKSDLYSIRLKDGNGEQVNCKLVITK